VLLEGWQSPGLRLPKYIDAHRALTVAIPKTAFVGDPRRP
jgi:hypothetical protein